MLFVELWSVYIRMRKKTRFHDIRTCQYFCVFLIVLTSGWPMRLNNVRKVSCLMFSLAETFNTCTRPCTTPPSRTGCQLNFRIPTAAAGLLSDSSSSVLDSPSSGRKYDNMTSVDFIIIVIVVVVVVIADALSQDSQYVVWCVSQYYGRIGLHVCCKLNNDLSIGPIFAQYKHDLFILNWSIRLLYYSPGQTPLRNKSASVYMMSYMETEG